MPNTVNKALNIPNTGDLPGTWGSAAVNPNMSAIDGMFGGFTTVSLGSSSVTLTTPVGALTPGSGPTQSQNALIVTSGVLTADVFVRLTLPGYYIIRNTCTGASDLRVTGVGGGSQLGIQKGAMQHLFFDGSNCYYVNLTAVGSYMHIAASSIPRWIQLTTGTSFVPWLVCDGTVYNISDYPALGGYLGSTFGGNGSTTFGVPDTRGRYLIPMDSTLSRITAAGCGINGNSLGAAGGSQFMQQHNHSVTDPTHFHNDGETVTCADIRGSSFNVQFAPGSGIGTPRNTSSSSTGISIQNTGSGSSQNVPPGIVSGLCMIKT